MKAIVYHGPGKRAWEEVPDATIIDPTDAVVRVETTTICGTDLHILKGDVPAVTDGRILGHDAVGVVTEVGADVKDVEVGDRVIVSCVSNCMECSYCKEGLTSHCQAMGGIGWVFGHLIDGTQAELVRVPFADNGLIRLPEGVTAEQGVMLSDILPTGYEIGVLSGQVEEGDTVLVVGAGPVGLSAIMTAAAKGAGTIIAVDGNEFRLESARKFGATHTFTPGEDTTAKVKELTEAAVDFVLEDFIADNTRILELTGMKLTGLEEGLRTYADRV